MPTADALIPATLSPLGFDIVHDPVRAYLEIIDVLAASGAGIAELAIPVRIAQHPGQLLRTVLVTREGRTLAAAVLSPKTLRALADAIETM